ncbi:MAG: sodium:dicarboxylate symporter [Pirellulaceae bacterium]|nr:MAG: sodium:dicarboxylate symporter [Pirellulaceae bacterium]
MMRRWALHWQILVAMVVGALAGIALNVGAGQRTVELTKTELAGRAISFRSEDSLDRIHIEWEDSSGKRHTWQVDPSRRTEGSLASLEQLAARDPVAYELFMQFGQSPARYWGQTAKRTGNLFLRLLQMVAVPLIISSLVTGILGLGGVARLGKMLGTTLVYYIATSSLAIITGLVMVRIFRPGLRYPVPLGSWEPPQTTSRLGEIVWQQIETLMPSNPLGAVIEPNFLSIISFSLIFAIFTLIVGGKAQQVIQSLFEALFEVFMAMTKAIIRLAPLGVFFLMLYVTATQGAALFASLAWYMVTVFTGLVFHAVITLPLILLFVARVNPWRYANAVMPALLTAFSSASSNGTLPLTMNCVEERAGISNRTSSFVLPLGATINMDGTALYEAVAVLFVAELYYGGDLLFSQQLLVAFTALLASVGAAGIPHAGLVMMLIVLQAVGLPVTLQGVIIAVDRVLDMCRTCVNVWSDACGCAVVERLLPPDK